MNLSDLNPSSIYRVTRDVTNPHPDRRCSDWFKQPVVKSGKRLVPDTFTRDNGSIMVCGLRPFGGSSGSRILRSDALCVALLDVLEEEPRSLDSVLASHGYDSHFVSTRSIIYNLVAMCRVSLEDIESAIAYRKPDEE